MGESFKPFTTDNTIHIKHTQYSPNVAPKKHETDMIKSSFGSFVFCPNMGSSKAITIICPRNFHF